MPRANKVKVPGKLKAAEMYAYFNMRISALEAAVATLLPGFENMLEDDDAIEDTGLSDETKAEMRASIRELKEQLRQKRD